MSRIFQLRQCPHSNRRLYLEYTSVFYRQEHSERALQQAMRLRLIYRERVGIILHMLNPNFLFSKDVRVSFCFQKNKNSKLITNYILVCNVKNAMGVFLYS